MPTTSGSGPEACALRSAEVPHGQKATLKGRGHYQLLPRTGPDRARMRQALQTRLVALYLSGLSYVRIGELLGVSRATVQHYLVAAGHHYQRVTRVLTQRAKHAAQQYDIRLTRLHATLLNRERPQLVASMIERSRPTSCPDCQSPCQSTMAANLWHWKCSKCASTGVSRRPGFLAHVRDPGPRARLRALLEL